MLTQTEKRCY